MISFVAPAHDEEELLGATLLGIRQAAAELDEEWEVIVVDDASTDRTAEVAEEAGARVVRVECRHIAAARNAGARAAGGDKLLFVDADTVVNPEVVRAAAKALDEGAAGGGAAVRFDEPIPRYARILLPISVAGFRIARLAAGCFVFCTAEAFVAAGGFDETLYVSEEIAMSRALARQGRFVVLRESVTTSGRKLRDHSGWRILRVLAGIALRGRRVVRSRKGLEFWYGKARNPARR